MAGTQPRMEFANFESLAVETLDVLHSSLIRRESDKTGDVLGVVDGAKKSAAKKEIIVDSKDIGVDVGVPGTYHRLGLGF